MSRRLPNFLYLGPDKSGSSWLFEVLRNHPDCFVPACKDVYYFDEHYDKGLDWYLDFFRDARPGVPAMGELSHSYLFSMEAADRIRKDLPGVKLMASLRQPVERCYSHYLYLVSSGLVTSSFAETIDNRPGLTRSSYYAKSVEGYLERFGAERFKVLFFDDLKKDPRHYASQVYDFLGLSFNEAFDYDKKVREARAARNVYLARLAKHGALMARKLGLVNLVGVVKHGLAARLLYRPLKKGEAPKMDPEVGKRLLERYIPDIEATEKLLGVNLDHWKQ
ncbi:MAG TPA: sulfotransferase [Thiobacillaceae bacterium]|nr:sulfotransferase [Thiobacillaceae bacterium]HNA81213.1 sulfotransferase [Thiobacillaceae bacterium]HNF87839.1 sulfotransferase [Thiobacillaceae bacterium]HNH87791.1 sulfotransferase [Thiobacillaceae bacterium]HNI06493.1 sulfotransferase [Thiobacillaceae bacterium]